MYIEVDIRKDIMRRIKDKGVFVKIDVEEITRGPMKEQSSNTRSWIL